MTAISPASPPPASDGVLGPLREVARRGRRVRAGIGALRTVLVFLSVLLAASLVFGRWTSMPVLLRVALAVLAWAAVLASAVRFLGPALRRARLSQAALRVESQLPDTQERVRSAAALAEERDPRFTGSPELLRHLFAQAEQDVSRVDPAAVVPTRGLKRWAACLAPVLLLWVVLAALMPRTIGRGLVLAFNPWRTDATQLLAGIDVRPGDVRIVRGDAVPVRVTVARDSLPDARVGRAVLTLRDASGRTSARDLGRDGEADRTFAGRIEDVRESFQYKVESAGNQSRWFDATVVPRPAVARLDLEYRHPVYTGLPDRTERGADGTIRAMVGTRVTLTVHATTPVALGGVDGAGTGKAASHVVIDEGKPYEEVVPLMPVPDATGVYTARISVQHSGTYKINLLSPTTLDGGKPLWNGDNEPRVIDARFDAPPAVSISSPGATEVVGPDDAVPVTFEAADDFGVGRVEAIVQVDDRPAKVFPVDLAAYADRRAVDGQWRLDVAYHLREAGATDDAKRITYQLKATDNRDPDPQSGLSARQVLEIQKWQKEGIATRIDKRRAEDMSRAIDQAKQKLDRARPQLDPAKNKDQPMTADQQKRLRQAQEQIVEASREFAKAADEEMRDGFEPVAEQARAVADEAMREAAEQAARAALEAQDPERRARAADEAQKQIEAAGKQLETLKAAVQQQQARLETARLLDQANQLQHDVAARQARLAEEQKAHQADTDKADASAAEKKAAKERARALEQQQSELAQRQQEAIARVNAAVQREEALRDPQAGEDARRLAELTRQVNELGRDQGPLHQQVAQRERFAELVRRANDLAERQAKLNEEINAVAREERAALQDANAQPPSADHQNNIEAALRQPNFQQANEQQKQSAEQLARAAEALNDAARRNEPKGDPAEQAKQDAQRDLERVQQAGRHAAEVTQKLQNAGDANSKAEARKAAEQAAEGLAKRAHAAIRRAEEAANAAAASLKQAQADQRSTEAARQAADQQFAAAEAAVRRAEADAEADPHSVRQAQAAQKSVQAAQKQAQAAHQAAETREKTARVAAKAADEAREAAQDAEQRARDAAKAAADDGGKPAAVAKALQKAGQDLEEAARDVAVAERANFANVQQRRAAEVAERMAQLARKQLDLAAETEPEIVAQQRAQENLRNPRDLANQQAQLAQRAEQAAEQAAQVRQASAARNSDLASRADDAHSALKEAARAQAAAKEAQAKEADALQAAEQANEQAHQSDNKAGQQHQQATDAAAQAQAARDQAARLNERAAADESEARAAEAAGDAAQAEQLRQRAKQLAEQARQSDASADGPSRQAAERRQSAVAAGKEAASSLTKAAEAQQQAQAARQASAEEQAKALAALLKAELALREPNAAPGPADAGSPQGGGDPQQAMRRAAENVQEATQAQQQAFANNQNNRLAGAQAARALRDATRAMSQATPGAAAQVQADGRSAAPKQASRPGTTPGGTLDPKAGLTSADASGGDRRPQTVRELGISAADWARLGPLRQQELLNAAQQSGPPAYREMIKNYFVKIARIQSGGDDDAPSAPQAK